MSKKEKLKDIEDNFLSDPYKHFYNQYIEERTASDMYDEDGVKIELDQYTRVDSDPIVIQEYIDNYFKEMSKEKEEWLIKAMRCDPAFMVDPVNDYYRKLLPQSLVDNSTEQEIKEYIAVYDPVTWGELYLLQKHVDQITGEKGWRPRTSKKGIPYQAMMIRCKSRHLASRAGRRCLPENMPVLMADGTFKSIKDIKAGDSVISKHYTNGHPRPSLVTDTYVNGVRPVYKIKTDHGMFIECTSNHPLLAAVPSENKMHRTHQWKSIDDGLKVGDKIVIQKGYDKFGEYHDVEVGRLLGYLLTDGSLSGDQTPKFTSNTMDYILEVQQLSTNILGEIGHYKKREESAAYDFYFTDGNKGTPNKLHQWTKKYDLFNKKTDQKRFNKLIWSLDRESAGAMVNRLYSGDGCVSTWEKQGREIDGVEVKFTTSNYNLLLDLQQILWKVGVFSRVKIEIRKSPASDKMCTGYNLCFADTLSIRNFFEFTGLIYGKEKQSQRALDIVNSRAFNRKRNGDSNYCRTKIKSIEYVGEKPTYDITVANDHNFVVNGIVTHNTGKSSAIVVRLLHRAFTWTYNEKYPAYNIVIFTPNQSQLNNLFKMMEVLIDNNPVLLSGIINNGKIPTRQNPVMQLQLKNGVTISGYVSGSTAIRSSAANYLVLDEASFLETIDVDSVIALLAENNETELWVSSTPKGFKDYFYERVFDPSMVSFYFPTHEFHPFWSIEMRDTFKSQLTESGYHHEIEAIFSSDGEGVFQRQFVDESIKKYSYNDLSYDPSWYYGIGVDWNDVENGTQIYVLGYNTELQKYKVFSKDVVSVDGWQQMAAVEKIKQLNRVWKPHVIYVDEGHGSTGVELLHDAGNRASVGSIDRNLTKVKPINFSSNFEIRDPFTKQKVKKQAKPYLVNNAVRVFENLNIEISDQDFMLIKQLEGYKIDHVTQKGVPVYMADKRYGDHALDALMLALLGFHMEFSSLVKPRVANNMSYGQPYVTDNKLNTVSPFSHPGQSEADKMLARDKAKEKEEYLDANYQINRRLVNTMERRPAFNIANINRPSITQKRRNRSTF